MAAGIPGRSTAAHRANRAAPKKLTAEHNLFCALCGQAVDTTVHYRDPQAFECDHIKSTKTYPERWPTTRRTGSRAIDCATRTRAAGTRAPASAIRPRFGNRVRRHEMSESTKQTGTADQAPAASTPTPKTATAKQAPAPGAERPESAPEPEPTHTVAKGETLEKIAERLKTMPAELQRVNAIKAARADLARYGLRLR